MDQLTRDLQVVRSKICDRFLIVLALVSVPALAASLYRAVDIGWQAPLMPTHIVLAGILWTVALFRRRIPYVLRAGYLVFAFLVLGFAGLWQFGALASVGVAGAIATPTLATVFFGRRVGGITLAGTLGLCGVIGLHRLSAGGQPDIDLNAFATLPSAILANLIGAVLVAGALYAAIALFGDFLFGAMRDAQQHRDELAAHKAALEALVDQRTRELRREKAALEEKSKALARSNEDLETFAHAVSHDLKAPLSGIAIFAELLHMKYRGRLDGEAAGHLDAIAVGTRRMAALVDGLLQHARVTGGDRRAAPTDLNAVLAEVTANLALEFEPSGAVVTHDPLPTVDADAFQMARLLQNLLDNAVKYHAPGRRPAIHVGAESAGDAWVLSVRDNGVGVPPADRERVFGMFERGVSPDGGEADVIDRPRIEGSGIGLATCRQIVERRGGRIWVEAAPGGGSIFRFTLPKAEGRRREAAE